MVKLIKNLVCIQNLHFGKIILVLMLVFGVVIGNIKPVMANEPLYYYDKYEVVDELVEGSSWRSRDDGYVLSSDALVSSSYTFDSSKGYIPSGYIREVEKMTQDSILNITNSYAFSFYTKDGKKGQDTLYYIEEVEVYYGRGYPNIARYKGRSKYAIKTGNKVKGNLLKSNIIGKLNQYPYNGIHSDGYWYVRKGLVNTNPTITITTPSENSYFV